MSLKNTVLKSLPHFPGAKEWNKIFNQMLIILCCIFVLFFVSIYYTLIFCKCSLDAFSYVCIYMQISFRSIMLQNDSGLQWINSTKDKETITAIHLLVLCVKNLSVECPHKGPTLSDVIMGAMASQITSLKIVYSNVYSGTDERKYQSVALLAFVRGIHQWLVNSPHKGPETQKMFPFDDVIMGNAESVSMAWHHDAMGFNTLRLKQNGRHFADDMFKWIFLKENVWIPIKISLKFVPRGPINNIPALVQIMAWRRPGDKPLSGPMMVRLPTHICVTRPQWVNHVQQCKFIYFKFSYNFSHCINIKKLNNNDSYCDWQK